jgi:hypothetical protein
MGRHRHAADHRHNEQHSLRQRSEARYIRTGPMVPPRGC